MLQPGTLLQGRFLVERVLGQGGMGAVYLAVHQALGQKKVAIKEMMVTVRDANLRDQAVEQFRREAHILASLDHPGLVAVIDFFTEDGGQYLVMDLVNGRTLEQVVNERFDYPPVPEVMGWMDQVCDVLEFLHTRKPPVLVRDLKPDNIMLDESGRIRLIDFGIARVLEPQVSTNTFLRGSGTPGYAPIEQYGGRTDPRTDIYALGATLYSVLTREVPPPSVLRMTGEEALVRPSLFNPAISTAMEAAILRMMALYREDRHAGIAEVRQALQVARLDPPGEERFRFCTQCGTPRRSLDGPCSSCGARLEPGAISALTRWLTDLTPLSARSPQPQPVPATPSLPSGPSPEPPVVHHRPFPVPSTPDTVVPQAGKSVSGEVPIASAPTVAVDDLASPPPGAQPASLPPARHDARIPGSLVAGAADAAGERQRKVRVVPLVLLAGVLILAGFGALRAVQRARFHASPAVATLLVSTVPPGALLKVDGSSLGATPQRVLSLGVGSHELQFSCAGYDPQAVTLQVQPPDVPGAHVRLRLVVPRGKLPGSFEQVGSQGRLDLALRSSNGEVVVDVKPDGGDLLVDGRIVQHTLLRGTRIPLAPGPHDLEMRRADCAPVKRTVDIRPGRTVTWTDTMASLLCTVTFKTSPAGAQVYLDGSRVGRTPLVLDSVRPIPHLVRFERVGYDAAEVRFGLEPSSQKVVSSALVSVKGEVALEVDPPGFTVLVDGKPRGRDMATGARLKLVPGRYDIQLHKPGHNTLRQVVEVRAGTTVTLKGHFEPQMASVTLDSSPRDAWVMVNGHAVGRTPLSLPRVPPGTYHLKVGKSGFAVCERTVTLAAGTQEALTIPLVHVAQAGSGTRPNQRNANPYRNPRNQNPGQRGPWRLQGRGRQ